MGPTYRLAVLINGKYEWMKYGDKVYETCRHLDAHAYSDNRPNSKIVSSWDGQWKLPENPKVTSEQAFDLLMDACQTALDNLTPLYSSDHIVMKRLKAALAAGMEVYQAN
jgi:hypothetical protein